MPPSVRRPTPARTAPFSRTALSTSADGEEARPQQAVGFGHDRLDRQRALVGADGGGDEPDLAGKGTPWVCVDIQRQRAAPP